VRAKRRLSKAPSPAAEGGGKARLKGRHWVALWLLAFLLTALVVVRRQSAALEASRELQQLHRTRSALEVSRSGLIGEIDRAKSRAVLVPLAQRKLGLRLPQDSEITILQEPRPR